MSKPWRPVPEHIRQQVIAAPPDVSLKALERQLGISRASIRAIRQAAGIAIGGCSVRHIDLAIIEQIAAAPVGLTNAELGRRYGISREMVRRIRSGESHRRAQRPQRTLGRSCLDCRHWWEHRSMCSLGFPEAASDGPVFAVECHVYADH